MSCTLTVTRAFLMDVTEQCQELEASPEMFSVVCCSWRRGRSPWKLTCGTGLCISAAQVLPSLSE